MLCRLRLLSVRLLSFRALLATCKKQNLISVNWKEMNTVRMHRIERALLQNVSWLPFAVAPHPPAFDALPPPPSFCPPPPVRCAPGDMQKTKSDLRQLEGNEHDTYAQNRESGTAEICMVTFCCCSSSTCYDALPPPPSFCLPPLVQCAPGNMQKTKSDLRQLERNEQDMYAQNRESGTAEGCMVTFCCCSSSTCF